MEVIKRKEKEGNRGFVEDQDMRFDEGKRSKLIPIYLLSGNIYIYFFVQTRTRVGRDATLSPLRTSEKA